MAEEVPGIDEGVWWIKIVQSISTNFIGDKHRDRQLKSETKKWFEKIAASDFLTSESI